MRPSLELSAMRVSGASGAFTLRQSDRYGIIRTSRRARLAEPPKNVLSLVAGLEARGRNSARLRLGYAGLLTGGETRHAAVAALRIDF